MLAILLFFAEASSRLAEKRAGSAERATSCLRFDIPRIVLLAVERWPAEREGARGRHRPWSRAHRVVATSECSGAMWPCCRVSHGGSSVQGPEGHVLVTICRMRHAFVTYGAVCAALKAPSFKCKCAAIVTRVS